MSSNLVKPLKICVIAPAHNEELGISEFISQVAQTFSQLEHSGWLTRLVIVEDGSRDGTWAKILATKSFMNITQIRFSRNFGHQTAVWAGLENLEPNEFAVVMDSDLQDSPSEILKIAAKFKEGFDCIFMRRQSRQDGLFKRIVAKFYYKIMSRMTSSTHLDNVGDFYGLSPRSVKSLLQNKERIKYIRGLVSQLGFKTTTIEYARNARYAGKTNYTITKMFSLALAGVTGFSITPLIITVYLAAVGSVTSLLLILYVLWLKLFSSEQLQPGWAFLSIGSLLMSSFALSSLATISLYIARIVQEVKHRPLFYIDELIVRKPNE
ncbi:WcaA Glycosyltransferases involved in cell wall biogenesis [Candidatus Planktophila versatilis]|uniref:glycosyltransferase family 2 protein n=1 Tax=Candidatus Planktophila versatilis TaxID=1884905 RepID=UPI003BEF361B